MYIDTYSIGLHAFVRLYVAKSSLAEHIHLFFRVGFGVCDDTARDDFNEIKNSFVVHFHLPTY